MSIETWTLPPIATASGSELSRWRPPSTAVRGVAERMESLAGLVANATGNDCAEITVTGEDGVEVHGHWPETLAPVAGARRVVVLSDGRCVTLRLPDAAAADGTLMTVAACAAAGITRSADDGPGGAAALGGLVTVLANAVGRPVVVQDAEGSEAGRVDEAAAPAARGTVRPVAVFAAGEGCRTWPVRWRGGQVGRLWLGPGRALSPADLALLRNARAFLGTVLAR